ncbi:MAG: branched-chain amino acid ABC transporter permease [Patulibacter sp.]
MPAIDLSRWRTGLWPVVALVAVLLLVGAALGGSDAVMQRVGINALIFVVLVVGLWSFSGVSGVVSFGHLAFAALGAYTCAFLTIPPATKQGLFPDMPGFLDFLLTVHTGFWPAVLIAAGVSAAFALLLSPAIVRLSGVQAGIATLAVLVTVYTVLLNWDEVTRGSSTMIGVPADFTLGRAIAMAVVVVVIAWFFSRSRVGLRLKAARADEVAARSIGLHVVRDRTVAWVLSAAIVGAGGAGYSHFITTFAPNQFYLAATFTTLAMLVIGGMRSLTGAVLGTLVYSALAEILRRVQSGQIGGVELPGGAAEVVLAILLLVILVKRPGGLTNGRELPVPRWPMRRGGGAEEHEASRA